MALSEEEKQRRAEARKAKEKAELQEAASRGSRPGMNSYRSETGSNEEITKKFDLELSPIEHLAPATLEPNPGNPYPALSPEELEELSSDVASKGVMIPLIARPDGVLVCGHNRLRAALQAGLETVPVQTLTRPFPLPPALEREIMKSENDRRRGGNWNAQKKREFVEQNFKEQLEKDRRGGDRKSGKPIKSSIEPLIGGGSLAEEISMKSKGEISPGTAKRIVADIRKEKGIASSSRKKVGNKSEINDKKGTQQNLTKPNTFKGSSGASEELRKEWGSLRKKLAGLSPEELKPLLSQIENDVREWKKSEGFRNK